MSADCAAARSLTRRLTARGRRSTAVELAGAVPSPSAGGVADRGHPLGGRRSASCDGTQSVSTHAPPMPSRSTTVTSRAELRGDQRRLVAGRAAADDHDAGHADRLPGRERCCRRPSSPVRAPRRHARVAACRTARVTLLRAMGLYAAYGSNMDPAQMRRRCPHSPLAGTGWLRGWRLTFGGEELGWEGALATWSARTARRLRRALRRAAADEQALDSWEGADHGLYQRSTCACTRWTGTCWPGSTSLDAFEGGLPSARYLGVIADAAEAAGAPDDYVAELRSRECPPPSDARASPRSWSCGGDTPLPYGVSPRQLHDRQLPGGRRRARAVTASIARCSR